MQLPILADFHSSRTVSRLTFLHPLGQKRLSRFLPVLQVQSDETLDLSFAETGMNRKEWMVRQMCYHIFSRMLSYHQGLSSLLLICGRLFLTFQSFLSDEVYSCRDPTVHLVTLRLFLLTCLCKFVRVYVTAREIFVNKT